MSPLQHPLPLPPPKSPNPTATPKSLRPLPPPKSPNPTRRPNPFVVSPLYSRLSDRLVKFVVDQNCLIRVLAGETTNQKCSPHAFAAQREDGIRSFSSPSREPPPPSIAASPHRQPSPFLESSRTLAIATPDPSPPHRASNAAAAAKRRSLKRSIRCGCRSRS
ncbi:hypothetical protein Syun_016728 [Stephania yunnanensis]|uniref:Uncharacterized protein n=1 Tax=Stephania yunnanensis TaxID=152371 RepID=A0AAP0P564_9MAGN